MVWLTLNSSGAVYDASEVMKTSRDAETSAGVSIGSMTVRQTRTRPAPRLYAASSTDGSIPASAAAAAR